MPLTDKWTLGQLRVAVRRELLDPTGIWWTDAELNQYIDDWQIEVQHATELVWATQEIELAVNESLTWDEATGSWDVTTSSWNLVGNSYDNSIGVAIPSTVHKLDEVCWDGVRLAERTIEDLNRLQYDWRNAEPATPTTVYLPTPDVLAFWPSPSTTGTVTLEYPLIAHFLNDLTPMFLPGWTKYSVINYCCWRAYSRVGPNQNLKRASRRKKKFERQLKFYNLLKDSYLPTFSPSLRPAGEYEARILAKL